MNEPLFIWDFVADTILGQIVDWIYGQVMGFLGNFFAEMGNMGVELFELSWVQSIVLFFSYLAWALYVTGLVVACFECGIEYSSGRGNLKETALCAIKGFMAVSLFTVVPIRLYELSVTLQASLTAGITGYGTSIGEAATEIVDSLSGIDSLTGMTTGSYFGFASITSPIMLLFCIILKYGSNILVDFDQRDEDKTSANILILGNSGQGKSYLMKLLILNLLESGKSVISLDAEHALLEMCEAVGGCFADLMAGQYIINVLEPKCWDDG